MRCVNAPGKEIASILDMRGKRNFEVRIVGIVIMKVSGMKVSGVFLPDSFLQKKNQGNVK